MARVGLQRQRERKKKSRMMRCEWHTGRRGERRNASRKLLGKPDGKGPHGTRRV